VLAGRYRPAIINRGSGRLQRAATSAIGPQDCVVCGSSAAADSAATCGSLERHRAISLHCQQIAITGTVCEDLTRENCGDCHAIASRFLVLRKLCNNLAHPLNHNRVRTQFTA